MSRLATPPVRLRNCVPPHHPLSLEQQIPQPLGAGQLLERQIDEAKAIVTGQQQRLRAARARLTAARHDVERSIGSRQSFCLALARLAEAHKDVSVERRGLATARDHLLRLQLDQAKHRQREQRLTRSLAA